MSQLEETSVTTPKPVTYTDEEINGGSERLSNLPEVTQLVSVEPASQPESV